MGTQNENNVNRCFHGTEEIKEMRKVYKLITNINLFMGKYGGNVLTKPLPLRTASK